MSTNCLINFDHPRAIYKSGDTLNGYVTLETGKAKLIRGISININGYCKVSWDEPKDKDTIYFKAYHQLLNSVTYVVGSSSGEFFDFPPGTNVYTFSCELPLQLPTSISEAICKIKYKVIVTIDRRLRLNNVFKKEFTIHHTSDLKLMSSDRMPRICVGEMEMETFYSCCCTDLGVIRAKLEIPCDRFIPSQNIPFKLMVFNNSTSHLKETVVKLIACYTVRSTKPYVKEKEFTKVIKNKFFPNIPQHTNNEFTDYFYLPHLQPSHRTQYIDLEYKIIAKISGCYSKKCQAEIPLTIGTEIVENDRIEPKPVVNLS